MKKSKGIVVLLLTLILTVFFCFTAAVGIGPTGTGAAKHINTGLDLAGGVSITYQAKESNPTSEEMSDTIYKLQKRVEQYSTEALQENGYKIPEDISVMGFDNTELSGYTNPPLTTVNAPVYAMGIYGIRFILNLMKPKSTDYYSPMRVYLPCPIKVRNSCAKPKSL